MALEGTIQDFALPDIFQLIGIQRKTGILTLEQGADRVTIKFLEGQVVEADTVSMSLEDRIGTVLVRTGRITQQQLEEALEIQGKTLQRLGHILVKRRFISAQELVDALQIQSSQIIYRLFRWREGSYHFDAADELDYDHNHSTPISSETILMEGARMVDEWPIIERRIPSDTIVLRKTEAAKAIDLAASVEAPAAEPAVDDFDFDLGVALDLDPADGATPDVVVEPAPPAAPAIKLSVEERQVLAMVDGERTVREIVDLLPLAEFETFRALSEMVTRSLLEKVEVRADRGAAETRSARLLPAMLGWVAKAVLAAVALAALAGASSNRFSPWSVLDASESSNRLRLYAAMARLERIEKAVQVYYLDSGTFPRSLATLVQRGYLDAAALEDPWGRPFGFQLSAGGYRVQGQDADGDPVPELSVSRTFTDVQRLMIESAGAPASTP